MAYNPLNPNGQAAMANSQPVVIASNQTPVSVTGTTYQEPGSILAVSGSFTAPANQSVSGTVVATQLAGSILAVSGSFTPAANQSVSGAVTAPAGSIASVTFPAGSITAVSATQVTSPWIVAPNNSSMFAVPVGSYVTVQPAGSVMAVSATVIANQSVSGAVTHPPGSITSVTNPAGSVTTVIATHPAGSITSVTIPAGSVMAVSAVQPAGSLLTAIQLAGSVMAISGSFTPSGNQSVSGAVTAPAGSVMNVVNPAGSITAVSATQAGTAITSLVSTVPSSVLVGASIFGQLPAGTAVLGSIAALQGTNPWAVVTPAGSIQSITMPAGSIGAVTATAPAGSIMTVVNPAGSVTAVSGISFSLSSVVVVAGSIFAVPMGSFIGVSPGGSVTSVAFPGGSIASVTNPAGSVTAVSAVQPAGSLLTVINPAGSVTTILGTFAEDAAFVEGGFGLATYGVRNDPITSIAGTDRDFSPIAVDDAGRNIVVPFAGQKACIISYVGSTVSGSVQLIQASVVGSRTYVTDFWLSNTGATTTLLTFQDGTTSIMGQFIVPAGGGFSSPGIAIPLKPVVAAGSDLCFKVSPSSSVVYVVVKGYQSP